jgi:hypothetical protein
MTALFIVAFFLGSVISFLMRFISNPIFFAKFKRCFFGQLPTAIVRHPQQAFGVVNLKFFGRVKGSFVEIPIPDGDKQPDLRNPVQMLTVDRSSLDYNVEEEKRLRENIITAVVGQNEEVTQREAFNEQQVKAAFESQSTVLNRVKKGFEAAQQFVDETVCRLRYGNMFVSAKVNYGTEFYLYDASELRNRYKLAKESGASEAELDALQNQIIETEYRNNPTQLQRMLILAELEPYRHLTRNEVLDLYGRNLIPENELRIKLNFANFVRRFERENTNILEFGTQIPFDQKISVITSKFNEYASENSKRG